jgi:hypothetical protein
MRKHHTRTRELRARSRCPHKIDRLSQTTTMIEERGTMVEERGGGSGGGGRGVQQEGFVSQSQRE